jgi:shikimate kinase
MGYTNLFMNITLIGMPGSGKTSVGKELAAMLDYKFIDLDRLMEKTHACPLPAILDKMGSKLFSKKEEETAIFATKGKNNSVISPGGSIIYCPKAMEHFQKISTIFYLKTPLAIILKRIGDVPRGIIGAKEKTLGCLYSERVPLYEKWAEVTVDGKNDAKKVALEILKKLRSNQGAQRF